MNSERTVRLKNRGTEAKSWSGLATRKARYVANTDAESDPLISPTHVRMLGAIFDYKDLAAQSWQVRPEGTAPRPAPR